MPVDLVDEWTKFGWQHCRTDEAGTIQAGKAKKSTDREGEEFAYVRVANIKDDQLDLADLSQMSFADPEKYELQPDDVLLAESSGSRELVGRSAMYGGSPAPLMFQNHVLRFRAHDGVEPGYALLVFRAFQKSGVFAKNLASASGISHLGLRRLAALPFPLPPTEVQREIVDRARSVQSSLDMAMSAMDVAQSRLNSFMADARDDAILGPSAQSWLGKSAGECTWPLRAAEDVVEHAHPIIYGILQPGPHIDDGIPYVRGGDIGDGRIAVDGLLKTSRDTSDRNLRSIIQEGDLVMNMVRNPRVAVVPPELEGAQMARGAARFRPSEGLDSAFLLHWLTSGAGQRWLQAHMRGIDMPGLNLRDLRRMPVPLPPLSEQRRLASRLDELASRTTTVSIRLQAALTEARTVETILVASLAYGPLAGATSEQILGSQVSSQSIDLRERLQNMKSGARSTRPTRRALAKTPANPGVRDEGTSTNLPQSFSGGEIVRTLDELGGSATPEELYRRLKLPESMVDDFYIALRSLIMTGAVVETRPTESDVALRRGAL